MGRAMLRKFLIQFSVDGLGCVPSLLFDLSNEGNCDLIQKVSCSPGPRPPPETPGHSWASLGQSPSGSLLLSPGSWYTQGFVCALQESVLPVLCIFWWLYGGANGDLLQEGLCHTQVCCTQSPLPLRQSSADLYLHRRCSNTQRQVWLSPCGDSWWPQGYV